MSCVKYLHYNGIRNCDSLSSYRSLLMATGFAVLSPALCVSPSRRTRCAPRINISVVSRVVSGGDRRHHSDFSCCTRPVSNIPNPIKLLSHQRSRECFYWRATFRKLGEDAYLLFVYAIMVSYIRGLIN